MATNEELLTMVNEQIRKAVFESTDLSAGGLLNPEQADAFIDLVIDYAVIWKDARVVKMNAPKRNIDKIGFTNRIMVAPYAEGDQPVYTSGDIKKPDLDQVVLSTVEADAFVDLGRDSLEDNIEGAGLEGTVVDKAARRIALDLEELYVTGDTMSGDTFLALLDGWLVQATSHVVANASAAFSEDSVFGAMYDALPNKYIRGNNADWRFYIPTTLEHKIRRERAARATVGGDVWLTGNAPLTYMGIPIVAVPMLPNTVSSAGNVLLVHPDNLVVGIQRQITYDREWRPRKRVFELTWTIRTDCKYETEDAVVKATNVA